MKWMILLIFIISNHLYAFYEAKWINVEGEWLYFSPCVDTSFLISNPGYELYDEVFTNFSYRSGGRIQTYYTLPFSSLDAIYASYTQLYANSQSSVSTPTLIIPPGQNMVNDVANSPLKKRFRYYAFETALRYPFYQDHRLSLHFFGGLHYAWIELKDYDQIEGSEILSIKQDSRFWGIGPEIALVFHYTLFRGFTLTGKGLSALLISHPHEAYTLSGSVNTEMKGASLWKTTAAWDFRGGIRYDVISSSRLYLEGGYETIIYSYALQTVAVDSLANGFFQYRSAAMHGPYFRAGLSF